MRILFLGDVVGRGARDEIIATLPELRKTHQLDAVIVNAENAAHGFGITPQICDDFYKAGVDCLTTGNHVWDQREIIPHIEKDRRLLRPLNYPEGTPGRGSHVIETTRGQKILVVNIMARLFMDALDVDDVIAHPTPDAFWDERGLLQTLGPVVDQNNNPINLSPTADMDIVTDRNGVNTLVAVSGQRLFTIDLNQLAPALPLGQVRNIVAQGISMNDMGGGFIDIAVSPFGTTRLRSGIIPLP